MAFRSAILAQVYGWSCTLLSFPYARAFIAAGCSILRVLQPSRSHPRFTEDRVSRLSAELQLVYIAYSWMRDLTLDGIHPSFLATLFDAVYLLKRVDKALNWTDLLAWLESDMATASLYAMLAYLNRHGLARTPDPILSCLASRQNIVGPLQLRLIHQTLDRFLLAGRPFVSVLPPPVPGRYSLRYQLRKRLRRFSRALG